MTVRLERWKMDMTVPGLAFLGEMMAESPLLQIRQRVLGWRVHLVTRMLPSLTYGVSSQVDSRARHPKLRQPVQMSRQA